MSRRKVIRIAIKVISFVYTISVLLFAAQTMLYATGGTPAGSGTAADHFQITDYADLKVVGTTAAYTLSAVYRLTGDIDASASSTEHSDSGFVPIGDSYANYFTGTLHGAGHVIKNLHINRSGSSFIGLFGCVWGAAIIDSLGVTDASIAGVQFVGGIAGSSDGTISNCYTTGNVSGSYAQVGGVVGDNLGTISNCYSSCSMSGSANDVGGVVGYSDGIVSNCYSNGNVSGLYYIGGVVGDNDIGIITNCYATGNIIGSFNDVGGVAGLNGNSGTVTNCYAIGTVTGANDVGGVVGEIYDSAKVSNCYWNTQTTGMSSGYGTITDGGAFSGSGLTSAQMKQSSSFSGWNFTTVWSMNSSINNGYPYLASNIATSVGEVTVVTPKTFSLMQNYPNPFNPTTTIQFSVEKDGKAVVKVFDIMGREAATLYDDAAQAGKNYTVTFSGAGFSSGVYFYTIESSNQRLAKKMIMVK